MIAWRGSTRLAKSEELHGRTRPSTCGNQEGDETSAHSEPDVARAASFLPSNPRPRPTWVMPRDHAPEGRKRLLECQIPHISNT